MHRFLRNASEKGVTNKQALACILGQLRLDRPMAKDTKHRIARAALELFVKDGYDAATTRQIAAKCDLSEGAIYRHYSSKDDIARELFLSIHRQLTNLIAEAGTSSDSIDEAVANLVSAYCQVADEDWTLYAFHLLQLHRFLGFWDDADGDPVTAVAQIIKRAIQAKQLPTGDPELLAGMAMGVVTQVAQNKCYGRVDGRLSDYADSFTRAILAILRAR